MNGTLEMEMSFQDKIPLLKTIIRVEATQLPFLWLLKMGAREQLHSQITSLLKIYYLVLQPMKQEGVIH